MGLQRTTNWFSERFARNRVARHLTWIAAATLFIGLVFLVWRGRADDPLARIHFDRRLVESRLTAFDYRAFSVTRSGEPAAELRASGVIAELQQQVERARTPDNLHRLALAELAAGKTRDAKSRLEEAMELRSGDAGILSDLAAAEMALGQVFDASEHSARALELDPTRKSAAFNWALSLEKLSNREGAIEAWEHYLLLDSESGWSDEARQRLALLRTPRPTWDEDKKLLRAGASAETIERLVRKYPYRSRARSHNILLPAWVESGSAGDLAVLRAIASLRADAGDPFLQDVVEHAAAHRIEVAPAFRVYAAAFKAQQNNGKETGALYAEASSLLERAGSPLAIAARIYATSRAASDVKGDVRTISAADSEAEQILEQLDDIDLRLAAAGNRYPSMSAEAEWVRGLFLFKRGDPQDCLAAYRRALEHAKRAGEIENQASIASLLASQLEVVGDPAEAEAYRISSLRRMDEINAHPVSMYTALGETAIAALAAGRPRVALAFIEAQTLIATRENKPLLLAESEAQRALALLEVGDREAAAAHIAAAEPYALQIADAEFSARTRADIAYIRGRIERTVNPARAVEALSEAIEIWDQRHWRIHSAFALQTRGELALSIGDRAGAERDFRTGIAQIEQQRGKLGEPAMRLAYFGRVENLFDRLMAFLLEDGRAQDALSVAEMKRARVLLDSVAASEATATATPLEGDEIVAAVRGRTAIVEIAFLDRQVELWSVHAGTLHHARSPATRAAIEAAVERHLVAIAANDEAGVRREGRWLYEQLILPVAAALPVDADLIIVPDGILQAFPFATLVMPNGQYLIDAFPITTAPSASMFLRSPAQSGEDLLIAVAQPAPKGFAALPRAEAEALQIASGYRRSRSFTGREIGPAEFLSLAGGAALVHFAGHATTDVDRPSQSALHFESSSERDSSLTAKTIAASRLRSHPLVILAACSTGRGKLRRNEGMDSLAAAFLQAGARGVVATLWDVEDDSSAVLFRTLHEQLRTGARAADALRATQRSLMQSNDPRHRNPAAWGSAVAVGFLERGEKP